jgi:NitT/TauT family transport system permease protein
MLIGILIGTVGGLITAFSSLARDIFSPILAVIKATPVASFIILALVWLSSRSLSFFIAFLMVFPPVYLNVLEGIGQADGKLLEMARVFRVPLWRQIRGIYVPAVLPYFRAAVSLGLGLCWKAGIAAEVIGLPTGSLGENLYNVKVYYMTADLFAWTAVIVVVSVVFEKLFLKLIDTAAGKAGG